MAKVHCSTVLLITQISLQTYGLNLRTRSLYYTHIVHASNSRLS
jgi:hypothetical protein